MCVCACVCSRSEMVDSWQIPTATLQYTTKYCHHRPLLSHFLGLHHCALTIFVGLHSSSIIPIDHLFETWRFSWLATSNLHIHIPPSDRHWILKNFTPARLLLTVITPDFDSPVSLSKASAAIVPSSRISRWLSLALYSPPNLQYITNLPLQPTSCSIHTHVSPNHPHGSLGAWVA
jgi:hypothetical protein